MRNIWKVLLAVLVIGFSVFLIQRSCHDGKEFQDPERSGGIGGVALSQRQTASPEVLAERRYELREKESTSATAGAARPAATEQLQGSWVLVDSDNTTFELTVVNETGSLKAYRSESRKEATVERKVRIVAAGQTCWVIADDDESGARFGDREPITLVFSFETSGAPRVVRLDPKEKEPPPLRVIAHTPAAR